MSRLRQEKRKWRAKVKRYRITALAVCAVLCFTLGFAALFVAFHSEHECSGIECETCVKLHNCKTLLESVGSVVAVFTFFVGLCSVKRTCKFSDEAVSFFKTPVALKVKLSY